MCTRCAAHDGYCVFFYMYTNCNTAAMSTGATSVTII